MSEVEADPILKILETRRFVWEQHELERWERRGSLPKTEAWKNKYKEPLGIEDDNLDDLPKNWFWASVSQVGFVISGQTPKGIADIAGESGTPWFKVGDMNTDGNELFIHKASTYLTVDQLNSLKLHVQPEGTVIFPKRGGAIATNKKRILFQPSGYDLNTMGVYPVGVEQKYFWYWFQTVDLGVIADGAIVPQINHGDIEPLLIPIAPPEQQKRIVAKIEELFSHIDAGIAALNKAKQLLKQYRQSVLKAAVTGELTKQWREDNNISLEGWQQSSIGEIAVVQTGKTPRRSNPEFWDNGDIPWLTSSATNNAYTHHAEQFVTQAAVDGGLKLFGSGTLLLAMYGEGKTRGQVTEITFQATCNQACAAIIVDEEKASKAYVRLRLLENYEETRKAASGGNQPNLNLSKVRNITLPLPALAEQSVIVSEVENKFDAIDRLANDIGAQLLKAEKINSRF
ncbi:restriction endonuclease subunit S [Oceanicoccus sp. KOV_DT_Chl]|uniref:restriction endonuclease subunit S n=1 Tax=Oceanicoccus sp. KOV_DT_Chl TaxID=1904639 RepID=UPI000C7A92B1|nr:restriction endonuclease subunit S [Oceanicoccus sp. KOV_DT_Chl]